jgi:hypothetical protein
MNHSFDLVKETLSSVATLTHPDPAADLCLAVDASNNHVGAVLQQLCGSTWRPLAFFSKKLDATQLKYLAFDRELLAAFLSVCHFRYLLDGGRFHILTDHNPWTVESSGSLLFWLNSLQMLDTSRERRMSSPTPCPAGPSRRLLM